MVATIYRPHRDRVASAVAAAVARFGRCIQIGVHTFTPVLAGVERTADVAVLYDPAREWERRLAGEWLASIRDVEDWRLRRNSPYLGKADGLTTTLRGLHPDRVYAGLELEVNQALLERPAARRSVGRKLAASAECLKESR